MRNLLRSLEKNNVRFSDEESIEIGEVFVKVLPIIHKKISQFKWKRGIRGNTDEIESRCIDRFLVAYRNYKPELQDFDKYINCQLHFAICGYYDDYIRWRHVSLSDCGDCNDFDQFASTSEVNEITRSNDLQIAIVGDAQSLYEFLSTRKNIQHRKMNTRVFSRRMLKRGWSVERITNAFVDLNKIIKEYSTN